MRHRLKKLKKVIRRNKLVGLALFVVAFGGIGGLIIFRSQAATGVCSTANVVGSATYNLSAPETAQYRLWVRMQVPNTTNTDNTNGVRIELAGSTTQCFTVTTTNSNAVGQWQWINSDASAATTPHITNQLAAGNYTVKVLGMKAGVQVDKVLLLKQDNTCTPSNNFTNGQPGDNCTTPAPAITFTATPSSVTTGGSTRLDWSATNASGCTAGGASNWTGSKSASGSVTLNNLTATTTYTLSCSGAGGSSSTNVTVTVTTPPKPTVTLTANPTSVVSGSASTLSWSSTNATSCSAAWTSSTATSGNQSTGNLTANRTYSISCTGAGGSTSASTTVTVTSTPPPNDTIAPSVTMSLPGVTVSQGQTSVTVNNQKSITWQPFASDASGIKSLVVTVNDQTVALSNGSYVFGAQSNGNGDYTLKAVATDNANNVTTTSFTVKLRHPDFNRSGRVDVSDLGALLSKWQQASTNYDINANNKVDVSDMGFLLTRWFTTN